MSQSEIAKSEIVNILIDAIRAIANEEDAQVQTEAGLKLHEIIQNRGLLPTNHVQQLPGDM